MAAFDVQFLYYFKMLEFLSPAGMEKLCCIDRKIVFQIRKKSATKKKNARKY